jgi:hypothetical protein
VSFENRVKVARLLFLLTDKRLRARYCACRRPIETEIDAQILKAMDEVEAAMAEDD